MYPGPPESPLQTSIYPFFTLFASRQIPPGSVPSQYDPARTIIDTMSRSEEASALSVSPCPTTVTLDAIFGVERPSFASLKPFSGLLSWRRATSFTYVFLLYLGCWNTLEMDTVVPPDTVPPLVNFSGPAVTFLMPERQWLAVSTTLSATRLPPQTKLPDLEEMATYDGYDETFAFCAYAKRLSAGSCALQTPERERQTNTSTAKTTTHDARHGLVVRKD